MKTKKLNFEDFTQDKLTRKQSSTIKAGWDVNGKPPTAPVGNGGGTGGYCYYDFETGQVICEPIGGGDEVSNQ